MTMPEPTTTAAGRFADLYAARRPHWLLGRVQPRRRCAVCGHRVSRARHMLGLTVCSGYCYAVKYQGKAAMTEPTITAGGCPRCGDRWTDHAGVEEPICHDKGRPVYSPPFCDAQGCRGRWQPDQPHDRCSRRPATSSMDRYCPCGGSCHFSESPCSLGCMAHNADVRHRPMRALDDDATCVCLRADDHPMHGEVRLA